MTASIKTRAFLVGCPRSGTTLLQSMLFAHPSIYSLPETAFFDAMVGIYKRAFLRESPRTPNAKLRAIARDTLVKFGFVERRRQFYAWRIIREVADSAGLDMPVGSRSFLISRHAAAFVELMDRLTLASHKSIWLEKTPDHLFYVKQIARLVPGARFLHIIRNGTDNVASLYDAAQKHPSEHWNNYSTVEASVRRWNVAVQESQKYRTDPAHYFVRYEHLASNPHEALNGICEFLGCRFDERMVTNHASAAAALIESVARSGQHVKAGNLRTLAGVAPSKYLQLFDAAQRAYVERTLATWVKCLCFEECIEIAWGAIAEVVGI
jgi:Sulfotransferase family